MALIFSRDPVWSQTTRSGFRQQVFIMYHSTRNVGNVSSIIQTGFNISQRGESGNPNLLLGDGLYVSRDIEKTLDYGKVCFKLLVYPGKTFLVQDSTTMEERMGWQRENSSAWIPSNNKVHPSGREETCVKSATQVRVLGVAYGHELLDHQTRTMVRNLFGTGDTLDRHENKVLDIMLEDLGIVYTTLVHQGSMMLLQSVGRGNVSAGDWNGKDDQLWTRTWDNCLENKATGEVMTVEEGSNVPALKEVEAAGDKKQKWRLDPKGRFLHKASNQVLCYEGNGKVSLKGWSQGDREAWKFRCLDQTKTRDTFVNFTPWQDMVNWE